ncbi:hypothetical protein Trco_000156 [Trichoderma cornu-damae]|uniref:Uncharacterized protein n=1 Tax=Trichoderma cornu-damae TaxID=654480 RepID=A0A9P8QPR3_9HYPO|nr:hypothetical protein Trco_000156 [Trichoderma cornu-damae]
MVLSIKLALLMGALPLFAAGNPLPQRPEFASYCTSTSFATLLPRATPALPAVVTVTRHTAAVLEQVEVDCGGCAFLEVAKVTVDAGGPLPTSFETVTAAGPTTFTRKYCSGFSRLPSQELGRRRNVGGVDNVLHFAESDDDSGVLLQGDDGENCTARILQAPEFNLGPTRTVYTTTTTALRIVNCGACTNVSPISIPLGVPPVAVFTTTITAKEPYTDTEFVCGTTTDAPSRATGAVTLAVNQISSQQAATPAQSIVTSTDFPSGIPTPECILSYALQPDRLDSTLTVFTSTVTHTSHRVCGPCALVWWTAAHEHTVSSFVKTVTKKRPKVETALVCSDD